VLSARFNMIGFISKTNVARHDKMKSL
jgi:hypothetical protein